jgi:hypothetical protein
MITNCGWSECRRLLESNFLRQTERVHWNPSQDSRTAGRDSKLGHHKHEELASSTQRCYSSHSFSAPKCPLFLFHFIPSSLIVELFFLISFCHPMYLLPHILWFIACLEMRFPTILWRCSSHLIFTYTSWFNKNMSNSLLASSFLNLFYYNLSNILKISSPLFESLSDLSYSLFMIHWRILILASP